LIYFDSVTGRTYTLEHIHNLTNGFWTNFPEHVDKPGIGGLDSFLDTNDAPKRFYRIEVDLPREQAGRSVDRADGFACTIISVDPGIRSEPTGLKKWCPCPNTPRKAIMRDVEVLFTGGFGAFRDRSNGRVLPFGPSHGSSIRRFSGPQSIA